MAAANSPPSGTPLIPSLKTTPPLLVCSLFSAFPCPIHCQFPSLAKRQRPDPLSRVCNRIGSASLRPERSRTTLLPLQKLLRSACRPPLPLHHHHPRAINTTRQASSEANLANPQYVPPTSTGIHWPPRILCPVISPLIQAPPSSCFMSHLLLPVTSSFLSYAASRPCLSPCLAL
jgi:hypothetical protein